MTVGYVFKVKATPLSYYTNSWVKVLLKRGTENLTEMKLKTEPKTESNEKRR